MAEGGVNGVGGIGSVAARVMSNVMLDMMQMMLQQGGGAKPGGEASNVLQALRNLINGNQQDAASQLGGNPAEGAGGAQGPDGASGPDGPDGSQHGGGLMKMLMQLLQMLAQLLQQATQQSGDDQGGDSDGGSGGGSCGAGGANPPAGSVAGGLGAPTGAPLQGAPGGANPNAGAPSGLPSDPSHDQAAQAIHDNLKDRYGLNDTQIAGVLGNLEQESGLHGDINQGGGRGAASGNFADDNGNGWGLAQWGGTRKQGEIAYAKEHGLKEGSLEANIGFMDKELDTTYSKTITDLHQSKTVQEATEAWDKDYELASDPHMDSRVAKSQEFLDKGL